MQKKSQPRLLLPLWLLVLERIVLAYVKVDEAWVEAVRGAAARGPLVYVLRNRSLIDLLCLKALARRHDLPPIGFVCGISRFFLMPFVLWLVHLARGKGKARSLAELSAALDAGGSAVVFLRRPAALGALDSRPVAEDGVRLMAEAQGRLGRKVLALPTVFLWGEHANRRMPSTMDFIFGSNDYPRLLRSVWLMFKGRSVHGAWVGEPIDLLAVRAERRIGDAELAGVVRAGVGRQIEKVRRAKLGSLTKPSARLQDEVLRSPRLRAELATIAAEGGIPKEDIEPRARAIIKKMAANYRPRVLSLFALVMAFVWKRIYTGIDVRREDVEHLRDAVANGALLVLPSHKSHIDYLVISQVMQDANIMLPHIAAGQNLSFWPLGWIFRSSGAFFIRRKFVNDRFYGAVVNAYVRRLIQEGYAIEIFVEGGRSRTGKLLRPRLGLLEMALRAVSATPGADLRMLPVFIGYEKVIEERAYARESQGAAKEVESIKGLIKTTRVLFSRYGRLHVRIGRPFSVDEVLAEMKLGRGDLARTAGRHAVANHIATRNLIEVNRLSVVTPSAVLATVLLSTRARRFAHGDVRRLAASFAQLLVANGADVSPFVRTWSAENGDGPDHLDRTIVAFVKAGRLRAVGTAAAQEYEVREGERLLLDYYKNNTIHFLVPHAIACAACLAAGSEGAADVTSDLELACRLYGMEFFLPEPGGDDAAFLAEVSQLAAKTVRELVEAGILTDEGSRLRVADADRAALVAGVLRNFHEIYYAALLAVRERAASGGGADPMRRARSLADGFLAEGRFVRPEGNTRQNLQNAFDSFKEMRFLRPAAGETPFAADGQGARLVDYLERILTV
ncbi:MAG: 1-acyl-sn-glycerol-3-phosphate acyltransferase [Deltaproteobacteria bacterium]|nr:1-acyl-sn-glycerol-3-phosphate acyltransferase [Deltaproteobacteria bacterium]